MITRAAATKYSDYLRSRPAAVLTSIITAASVLGYLVANRSRGWFYNDDWDFLVNRSLTHNTIDNLFRSHNGHWSTVPVIVYRVLFAIFGLKHFWPYTLPVLVVHAAVCYLLWRVLRRGGVNQWICLAVVTIGAINGVGAYDLARPLQICFSIPVALGLLMLLVAEAAVLSGRRMAALIVLAIVALMCSGSGLSTLAMVAIFVWLRHGFRRAVTFAVLPVLAYLAWYAKWGHLYKQQPVSASQRLQTPAYFWHGLSNVWDAVTGAPSVGILVLALLAIPLLARGSFTTLGRMAIASLVGAAAFYLLTGSVRVQAGVEHSTTSRYAYIGLMLMLPALGWALERVRLWAVSRGPVMPAAVAAWFVLALIVINQAGLVHTWYWNWTHTFKVSRAITLGTAYLVQTNAPILSDNLTHTGSGIYPSVPKLRALADQLPSFAPSEAQLVQARGRAQVAVTRATSRIAALPSPVSVLVDSQSVESSGCSSYHVSPTGSMAISMGPHGGRVQLSTSGSSVKTTLSYKQYTSARAGWDVTPNRQYWAATVVPNSVLRVYPPGKATVQVCLP